MNVLWAKVSEREKFVVYGAVAVFVGWILGTILGSKTIGGGSVGNISIPGVSYNYFSYGNAGLFAILALVLAIVTAVVIYLKVAPNMNINWPMPVGQILLGLSAATLICGVLTLLMQFTSPLSDPPVLMYLADVVLIGGGAVMTWFAYQEWTASKV